MIKGATLVKNYYGEDRQKCICGAKHPLYHNTCLACGRGVKTKSNYQESLDAFKNAKNEINEAGKLSVGKITTEII